jgi:hypothetical protein
VDHHLLALWHVGLQPFVEDWGMIWQALNVLFGWDYVAWRNSADRGIARVHVDGMGRVFYWRYKNTRLADFITEPERVIWLTCGPEKYMRTRLERTKQ